MTRWAFTTHVGPFAFTRIPRPSQRRPGLVALFAWPLYETFRLMFWLAKVIVVAVVMLVALIIGWVEERRAVEPAPEAAPLPYPEHKG